MHHLFGLTATRIGMSDAQKIAFRTILSSKPGYGTLHHGMCVGGDADGHQIARELGYWIVGHPPVNPNLRVVLDCDVVWPEKPYLDRNRDVVNECKTLIVAPREYTEQMRSGTWSTFRAAAQAKKDIMIVFPDGSVTHAVR